MLFVMEVYYTLFYITSAVLVAVIILKTYLFFSKSHYHQYSDWLHFSKHNIYNSKSRQTIKAKHTQNTLSLILLIFIIVDLSLLLMAHLS
jgi:hypothetical protein